MTIIDPIVQEHVAPHVAKIANIFKAPVSHIEFFLYFFISLIRIYSS